MTWRGMLTGILTAEPRPLGFFERQASYPWLIVGLVSIGAFIGQLDATIVQLALPTLGKTFSATLESVSWVSLAYLVAFASFLPIFGRLCEIYGRKSLYLIGYVIFITASLLCGLASDLGWLIAFRVVQGIGGSMLGANSIAILVAAIDQQRRGRALGYFAAAQAVGMCAGPAVGGSAAGLARLAVDILGLGAIRACGRGSGLADLAANRRPRTRASASTRTAPCCSDRQSSWRCWRSIR